MKLSSESTRKRDNVLELDKQASICFPPICLKEKEENVSIKFHALPSRWDYQTPKRRESFALQTKVGFSVSSSRNSRKRTTKARDLSCLMQSETSPQAIVQVNALIYGQELHKLCFRISIENLWMSMEPQIMEMKFQGEDVLKEKIPFAKFKLININDAVFVDYFRRFISIRLSGFSVNFS